MKKDEAITIMSHSMSEEDAHIVLKVIEKTIEVMNLELLISDEDFRKLTDEERMKEYFTQRVCSFQFNDNVKCIFFRFVGDETPLANVLFFQSKLLGRFSIPHEDFTIRLILL
jgi:hypothetical protein